jgi:hypothetical protein
MENIMQKVEEFNATPMLATSAVYDNLAGMARNSRRSARFRENPRSIYA